MQKVKTVFIGSGDFGIPILKKIVESDFFEVVGIVSQPDKPMGRKKVLTPTKLKAFSVKTYPSIPVETPDKISQYSSSLIKEYNPELIVVASYGQIIPDSLLNYPKFKCVNFHGSLLPKLRGAVPVQMAILRGFTETGVTLQQMAKRMDAGPLISSTKFAIEPLDTTESLMLKLAISASNMIETDLKMWCQGMLTAISQIEEDATYCYEKDIAKEKASLLTVSSVYEADRMVRAFYPWPVAWFLAEASNKRIKVFRASVKTIDVQNHRAEGPRFVCADGQPQLEYSDGVLLLEDIQIEGKKRGRAKEYSWLKF